jgi:chromosome segregation ATPase
MAIPSLVQGMIKTEDGKVFKLDSPKGSAWLESIGSFRFEPSGNNKPYTVRKESGIYWYGCRKITGKVRKKYIGKSSSLNVAKLEEIAEALEIPPVPQANKVAERVAEVAEVVEEVAEKSVEGVAEKVAEKVVEVAEDRLTALELQITNLQKAVEALQNALLGKLDSSDSLELPKVDNEVAEQLQNDLGNLKAENEKLRADYATLLESSTHVTNKLKEEFKEMRSQLETERADREEIDAELSELKQNSAPAATLSEKLTADAAIILSQLRVKRKKSKTDLADLQAILEILES